MYRNNLIVVTQWFPIFFSCGLLNSSRKHSGSPVKHSNVLQAINFVIQCSQTNVKYVFDELVMLLSDINKSLKFRDFNLNSKIQL